MTKAELTLQSKGFPKRKKLTASKPDDLFVKKKAETL